MCTAVMKRKNEQMHWDLGAAMLVASIELQDASSAQMHGWPRHFGFGHIYLYSKVGALGLLLCCVWAVASFMVFFVPA